ncbi:ATP-binding protein [Bacterioplanoides sp.]|uniref:ATP-binding protein n=1 Tax=Bacterioplanoides sp. TaxID=2066072 RepID=UPI003B5BB057
MASQAIEIQQLDTFQYTADHTSAVTGTEDQHAHNLSTLYQELAWLEQVIHQAIRSYLKQEGYEQHWSEIPVPDISQDTSLYAEDVRHWQLNAFERLTLALVMAPHLRPEILDVFFGMNELYQRGFTEFGGVSDKTFSGFVPTGQTLNFLISGNDPLWRTATMEILNNRHRLQVEQVLTLQAADADLPAWTGTLNLSESRLHYWISGEHITPELSSAFPAQAITTPLNWSDLVLEYPVMQQIAEIQAWLQYGSTLMQDWGLNKKVKPGYRALFYGPPGTGKTLTASLLAKHTGREIYRVDLSMVVSKYIGETEKNLSKVFDAAAHKNWILFFDEADALFGQRTETSSSNDRHANQQIGYLLQRIEDFPGVVILATNLKGNMDEAFSRRFQSMVGFKLPEKEERLTLWKNAFQGSCELADDVDLNLIAEKYPLAGGAIINVLRYCALAAVQRNEKRVTQSDILNGIRREYRKDNRTLQV